MRFANPFARETTSGGNSTPDQNMSDEDKPKKKQQKPFHAVLHTLVKGVKSPTEAEDVRIIRDGFKVSREARATLGVEREWVLNTRMHEGGAGQWDAWNTQKNNAYCTMVKGEEATYLTTNLVAPLVTKLISLATMTKPDATPQAASQAPRDVAAAEEAPFITAQMFRDYGGYQTYAVENTEHIIVRGLTYSVSPWDAGKKAAIPETAPTGELLGRKLAPVGAVDLKTLPPHMVYLDAAARKWADVRRIYIAEVVSYDELVSQFGNAAKGVKCDQAGASADWVGAYLPGATSPTGGFGGNGDLFGSTDPKNRGVLKITLFEKPSFAHPDDENGRDFPEGRHVVVAGDKRLYVGPLPYGDGKLPVCRSVYREAANHPYGIALVSDLRSPQQEYNRARTKLLTQMEAQKNLLFLDSAANVDPDIAQAVNRTGYHRQTTRTTETFVFSSLGGGMLPTFNRTPDASADLYKVMDSAWMNMQHISGIHDVNMGGTPTGVTAGITVELLQQGDTRQVSLLTGSLEQLMVDVDTQGIRCFAKYASGDLPRLVGLDDSGDPQAALTRALSFRAITSGGEVVIYCTPGSATPKTPAGEKQDVYDLVTNGLLDPANPQALIALKALKYADNNPIVRMVIAEQERMKAEARAQQQQAAMQAQAQAQAQDPTPADPLSRERERAQVEQMRQAGQTRAAQDKAHTDAQMVAIKTDAEIAKSRELHQQGVERDVLKAGLDAQRTQLQAVLQPRPNPFTPKN